MSTPASNLGAGAGAVVGLVLAAGDGARLGQPKQLARVAGRPMLQWVVHVAETELPSVIVVVPPTLADEIEGAVRLGDRTRVVVAHDASRGQSASLRAGLAAAPAEATAALVLLGDQPEIRGEAVRRVLEEAGRARIVRAAYRGRPAHPVLLDRALWEDLATLRGDQGARALIAADPSLLATVEVGGAAPVDIDTPHDLEALRLRWSRSERA